MLKCGKQIYGNLDSVLCDKCDKGIHKTCGKTSNSEYKKMQENVVGIELWSWNPCLDLAFRNITSEKLFSLYSYERNLK